MLSFKVKVALFAGAQFRLKDCFTSDWEGLSGLKSEWLQAEKLLVLSN